MSLIRTPGCQVSLPCVAFVTYPFLGTPKADFQDLSPVRERWLSWARPVFHSKHEVSVCYRAALITPGPSGLFPPFSNHHGRFSNPNAARGAPAWRVEPPFAWVCAQLPNCLKVTSKDCGRRDPLSQRRKRPLRSPVVPHARSLRFSTQVTTRKGWLEDERHILGENQSLFPMALQI